jgi:hypothetical protein
VNENGYKILGFAVWHGGRWYLRRAYRRKRHSVRKRAALAGLVTLVLGGAIAVLARRGR